MQILFWTYDKPNNFSEDTLLLFALNIEGGGLFGSLMGEYTKLDLQ